MVQIWLDWIHTLMMFPGSLVFFRQILFPLQGTCRISEELQCGVCSTSNQQKIYHVSSAFLQYQQYLKKGDQVEIKEI